MGTLFNRKIKRLIALVPILFTSGFSDAKSELDALTGGIHTRVAWRAGGHHIKGGSNTIKGFDSETGRIHTIWQGEFVVKPVLCSKGNRVLITTTKHKIYVVDWDGQNKKLVVDSGMCSDAWVDTATGKEWCVYRPGGNLSSGGITRCLIDDPGTTVRLWDRGEGSNAYPWFQMSSDGKWCAGSFNAAPGFIHTNTGGKGKKVHGTWSSMASDNSYIWFNMDDGHQFLSVSKGDEKIGWLEIKPPIAGNHIFGGRAAEGPENSGRYFSVSGGYSKFNKTSDGIELFVAKFGEDLKSVDGWARITRNSEPEHHSTVWIGVDPAVVAAAALPGDTNRAGAFFPWVAITSRHSYKYNVGDTLNLKWDSDDIEAFTISASLNGDDWMPLPSATSITPASKGWQDFKWVIPKELEIKGAAGPKKMPLTTFDVRLKVADSRDSSVFDITMIYEILDPWVKLTFKPAPAYAVGDTVDIKWEANDVDIARILVSVDYDKWAIGNFEGADFYRAMRDWGDYRWVIPDTLRLIRKNNTRVPLAGKTLRLKVAYYWDYSYSDSTTAFQVVGPSNTKVPQRSIDAWNVLPDRKNNHRLYIQERGNHRVRIYATDGVPVQKFECAGGAWHRFKIDRGPGVYFLRIGSGAGNVGRLFVNK